MAILITGGAGFIGSHVVEAFLERGDSVVCVDNLNDFYEPRRKQAIVNAHGKHPLYTFHKVDISDRKALAAVFEEHPITAIIHLAAQAGVRKSITEPELYLRANVIGTLNVLELAKEHAVLNVVVASSSSVYGTTQTVPFSESMKLDEQISPYAVSKKATENLCFQYSHMYGIPITCLRFFTVYGPRGRPDMAPYLFLKAILNEKPITVYGDGTTSRDYTYVGDIVQGIVAAHERPRPFGVFNIGSDTPITLNEFIATMETVVGKKALRDRQELQPGDVLHTWADLRSVKKTLDYEPKTALEQGLRAFHQWYTKTDAGLVCEYKPKRVKQTRTEETLSGLYESEYAKKNRFSFGKNWERFVTIIDERRIKQAEQSIIEFLGSKDAIKGKTFLDIGCGSGIFSLAAFRLGAKRIVSIDPDHHSVRATTQVRDQYSNGKAWTVRRGSALDRAFLKSLGAFDIVYSWGVLHHTGNMRAGLENVTTLVEKNGLLFIAIYNNNIKHPLEGSSVVWSKIKAAYNRWGSVQKWVLQQAYTAYLLAGITVTGHNPVRYVRSYHAQRGMDFFTDIKDWLGGYPYEYATVDEITSFYKHKGYVVKRVKEVRSLGCNEFLFKRIQ